MTAHERTLAARIQAALSPDLLEPARRRALAPDADAMTGHCAVATEALYFALGGKRSGYTPMSIQHEGTTHWFLRSPDGRYLDLTATQFTVPVPYARGRGRGFPTPRQGRDEPPPSRRAAIVLARAGLQSATPRINARFPRYAYYVLHKPTGRVVAGNEYREDAIDAMAEQPLPKADLVVKTRAYIERTYGAVRWARDA